MSANGGRKNPLFLVIEKILKTVIHQENTFKGNGQLEKLQHLRTPNITN